MSPDVLVGLVVALYLLGAFMSWSLALVDGYLRGWSLAAFTWFWPLMALYIVVATLISLYVDFCQEA